MPSTDIYRCLVRTKRKISQRIVNCAIAGLVLASAMFPSSAQSEELSGSVTLYGW